jgi:hypothetical protein
MRGLGLERVTGVLLLVGAVGILVDAWLSRDSAGGSWGLVPAYVGTTCGLVLLVVVLRRILGWPAAVVSALGVASTFVFWFSYPEHAAYGGLGSLVLGAVVLWLPGWGRIAAVPWVFSGTLGLPELVWEGMSWGPLSSFTTLGLALALTGAFVLTHPAPRAERSEEGDLSRAGRSG